MCFGVVDVCGCGCGGVEDEEGRGEELDGTVPQEGGTALKWGRREP